MARLRRLLEVRKRPRFLKNKKLSSSSSPSSSLLVSVLPQELITEIIARVAASSFTEFLATKLISKEFYKLAEEEEGYIYQNVSLKDIPIVAWNNKEKHSEFLKKCLDNKNPEALYRQGVVEYFGGSGNLKSAIKCLKEAGKSGYMEANYALGIIYILSGGEGEMRQNGIGLIGGMKKTKILRKKVIEYRESLKSILRIMKWKNIMMNLREKQSNCCKMQQQHHHNRRKRKAWYVVEIEEEEDENDQVICPACASDFEISSLFYAL